MNIDADAIKNIMRVVYGKFTINSRDAEALCKLLSSREEFLAWLLLRKRYAVLHCEVGKTLVDVASSTVVTPMSRRKESNFPVFEQQNTLSMEMSMRTLLETSKLVQQASEDVNLAVNSFASRNGNFGSIGKILNIKI